MRISSSLSQQTKRGDTIIEVMFAFAIFTLIAIITITMMNLGLAASERSLELVTARNELNAQAEALRFIHSSYISELTLPERGSLTPEQINQGVKYQQYKDLWDTLIGNTMHGSCSAEETAADGCFDIEYPLSQCETVYANEKRQLINNHAFVLNTRQLLSPLSTSGMNNSAIIYAREDPEVFVEPTLNARLLYTGDNPLSDGTSDDRISSLNNYTHLARAEGIWVVGVSGPTTNTGSSDPQPQYYDFYIETCWYGSGNAVPTSLDAVIRLYNPGGA